MAEHSTTEEQPTLAREFFRNTGRSFLFMLRQQWFGVSMAILLALVILGFVWTSQGRSEGVGSRFWDPLLDFCIDALGADKILFGIDSPFAPSAVATDWLDAAPISEAQRRMIYQSNAERVFGL